MGASSSHPETPLYRLSYTMQIYLTVCLTLDLFSGLTLDMIVFSLSVVGLVSLSNLFGRKLRYSSHLHIFTSSHLHIFIKNFPQIEKLIVCPGMLVILKLILGPHVEEGRVLPFQPSHAKHRACPGIGFSLKVVVEPFLPQSH